MGILSSDTSGRSRIRAFLTTFFTGQILTLVNSLLVFFTTPLLLRYLGSERFGLWRVLEVWTAYLALVPQCVPQAGGFLLVPLLTGGDRTRVMRFVGTMLVLGSVASLLFALGGTALLPWLDVLIPTADELHEEQRLAFLICLLAPLPLTPFLLLRVVLEADQRGYIVHAILAFHALSFTATALGLAAIGAGLPGQALAQSAANVVQAALLAGIVWRLYGWLLAWPDADDARALVQRAAALLLLSVLGGIAARFEYPLVNFVAGAEATTRYAIGQRLFSIYAGLVAMIGNSLWAAAAYLFFAGEKKLLAQRLVLAIVATFWLGTAGAAVIYGGTTPFLRLWVGEGYDPGPLTRLGFALTFPVLGVNIVITWVLSATGHMRAMYIITICYFMVTAICSIALGVSFGTAGVALGTAAGAIAAACTSVTASIIIYELPWVTTVLRLAGLTIVAVIYGFGCVQLFAWYGQQGWIELITLFAALWSGYLLLTWRLALSRTEQGELLARLRRK